ncbi:MAG: sporulation protein YqfD [Oscillospiraceae bacterium]|nr:sporulation protein YqfD [Oscillospiraceae bacterium]
MLDSLRGTALFKAEGTNLYKFINSIRENNMVCTDQHCKKGAFYGRVYRSDMKRLEDLAESCDIKIEFVERKGFRFRLFSYRMRFGIIAGLLAAMLFVFYISNIVVTIEVCGNTEVTEEQIVSALSDIGIYKGRLIADIDFAQCEKKLRLSIPEIAWTGIRHTGSRIVVDITETVHPPEMVNDDIPCNIVSTKDAQLTYAEVYSGKLMKKIGDGVKKGDVIVSGVIEDEKGHIMKRHSMGKIKGIYTEEYVFEQPFEENGQIYTGEDTTKKYIDFFGFRIPLFLKKPEFESFDYTESTNKFMIFGSQIPIGIVHSSYSPFIYDKKTYTEEEADEKLQQQTALHEKNFYDSMGIEIKDRKITSQVTGEKMIYKVKYTLEGDIGMDYEIYVKK